MAPVSAETKVTFLDVAQGDAIWVHDDSGYDILIDAGSGAINVQQATAVEHWNATLWTHGHADHIGGMLDVVGTAPVDRVYWNGYDHNSATFNDLIDLTLSLNIPMQTLRTGQTLIWGDCTALVLHPDQYYGDNNDAVVIRLSDGQVKMLLTGDAEEVAEKAMLDSGLPLSADLLKLGHHGSDTSTSPLFLKAVNPSVAILSVGENEYGLPSQVVLERVREQGIRLLRTDADGTITVVSDGVTFSVQGEATPKSGSVFLPWVIGIAQATPTPTPTSTPTASSTPSPSPTATVTSTPTPTSAPCPCESNTLNCENFSYQVDAQRCYDYCWNLGRGDVHGLDGDNDGLACEDLP